MIKIELAFGTPAEAAAALALLAGTKAAPAETAKDSKPGKPSAAPAAEPSSAKTEAAASTKSTAATPPADAPTYEKSGIPEKIKAMVEKDKAGIIKLLGEFGVKKGGELKPDQFDKFNAAIDKLAAGGDDLS